MHGLQTIQWYDVDYSLPPIGKPVLVWGGLAFISANEIWQTLMEYPPRPIQWRVTHWAAIPLPPQELLDATEAARK